jgi:hypothetical protein
MQKSETQDRAGTFRLGEGHPCCSQYVELLTSKDEDFSLQSTHHRDVRSFWISRDRQRCYAAKASPH